MNRQTFDNKYRNLQFQREEMDRKWKAYLREQEEMEFLRMQAIYESQQQSSSTSTGAGGGGGNGFVEAQTSHIVYTDPTTNFYKIAIGNHETLTISDPIDTELDNTTYSYNGYVPISGKGLLFCFTKQSGNVPAFFFIDVNGVVVEKTVLEQLTSTNWTYETLDGLSVMTYYQDPEDTQFFVVKWWMGQEVFTGRVLAPETFGYYAQLGSSSLSDGTFTTYYNDGQKNNVFLHNAKGEVIDITNIVNRTSEGIFYNDFATYNQGNFFYADYYNGSVYDKIRIIFADGSYKEISLEQYSPNNIVYELYGTSKVLIIIKPTDSNIDRTVLVYDAAADKVYTTTYSYQDNDPFGYVYFNTYKTNKFEDNFVTTHQKENLMIVLYEYSTFSGPMSVYTKLKVIWLFGGQTSFHEWTPASLAVNGNVYTLFGPPGTLSPSWLYKNTNEASIKQVFFTKSGPVDEIEFPVSVPFSSLSNGIEYYFYGNRQVTAIHDTNTNLSHLAVYSGTTLVTSYTINNLQSYGFTNINIFCVSYGSSPYYLSYIKENDSNFTEITSLSFENSNTPNNDDTCDYVNNLSYPTIRLSFSGSKDYLITDASATSMFIDKTVYSILEESRTYKDCAIYLYQDTSNNNNLTIDFINTLGNVLKKVSFNSSVYHFFATVDKRTTIIYEDSQGQRYFGIATLNGTTSIPIPNNHEDPYFNDLRYWSDYA